MFTITLSFFIILLCSTTAMIHADILRLKDFKLFPSGTLFKTNLPSLGPVWIIYIQKAIWEIWGVWGEIGY